MKYQTKIAIVVPIFKVTGSEGIAHKVAKALSKEGFDVSVLCSDSMKEGERDGEEKSGIQIRRFRSFFSIGKFARLWFPKNEGYDLIHFFGGYAHPHMFFLDRKNSKMFVSPFYPLHPRKLLGRALFSIANNLWGKEALRKADYCFAETNEEKAWIKKYNPKVGLLPFSLEEKYFSFKKSKRKSSKGYSLLFVGGHIPIKNIDILIRALPLIKKNVTLRIAGKETEYSKECKRLARRLGVKNKVKWLGFLGFEEKMREYHNCDLFILPSKREALGTTVIEAMSQKVPVITTNRGGLKEIVPSVRCLVEPNDERSLAEKINEFLEDPKLRRSLGEKGFNKVNREFRFQGLFKNYLKILKEEISC